MSGQAAVLPDGADDAVVRPRMLIRAVYTSFALILGIVGALLLVKVLFDPDLKSVASWLTASGWGWVGAPFTIIGQMSEADAAVALVITIASALLIGVTAMRIAFDVRTQSARISGRSLELDNKRLDLEISQMKVSFIQARFYAQCLAEPAERFPRITESIEAGSRTIRDTIAITVSTRLLPGGSYVVPLLLCSRGRLENGLRFYGKGGERISSLTHLQATAFSMVAIRELLRAAGGSALARYQDGGADSLESKVRSLLASTSGAKSNLYEAVQQLAPAGSQGSRLIDAAAAIVWVLAEQYPICAAIEVDGVPPIAAPVRSSTWRLLRRAPAPPAMPMTSAPPVLPTVRVGADRIVVPTLKRYTAAPPGLLARIERARRDLLHLAKTLLGVSPHSIDHPTTQAARTTAYHLAVRGPEGTYLAQQELRHGKDGGSLTKSQHRTLKYAMYPRRGQRTAHLYVRHPSDTANPGVKRADLGFDGLTFACRFYERMPGSLATALVASAAAFVISATIAAAALYIPPTNDAPVAEVSGLLQILLAFPFALTATSSFRRGGALWDGDLGARTVTTITVVVLVASLVVSTTGPMFGNREVVVMLWAAILITSACTTVASLVVWITRAFTQARFTRRADLTSWDAHETATLAV